MPPSPKLARWWLVLPAARLSVEQRRVVDYLTERIPAVCTARGLAVDFAQVLRDRDVTGRTVWLDRAPASAHAEFRDLAASLRQDFAPVDAAVRGPWSNGQTEGQVTKLKMLKRQTYGRASIALLRKRLLYAA
jgi:transposase